MCRLSLAPRPPSAVTRSIYLGTVAAIAVVATLSIVIYRSAVDEAVNQHSNQQLAMVRTAAVGVQSEIQALSARLRQFASIPSVQNLDVPVLSQRVEAAFGDNASGLINFIMRADVDGRLYVWTPKGQLLGKGEVGYKNDGSGSGPQSRQRVAGPHDSWLGQQRLVATRDRHARLAIGAECAEPHADE